MRSTETLIHEYKDWIAEDCLDAINQVDPKMADNISSLEINDISILDRETKYYQFKTHLSDFEKDVDFDAFIGDYFTIPRMCTFEPSKYTPVGWPVYEDLRVSTANKMTLALLELGIHESLEWITVCERGRMDLAKDQAGKIREYERFPLWPHSSPFKKSVKAKINNKWYNLTVSF